MDRGQLTERLMESIGDGEAVLLVHFPPYSVTTDLCLDQAVTGWQGSNPRHHHKRGNLVLILQFEQHTWYKTVLA